MFYYALFFFVVAVIAGVAGFSPIPPESASVAKTLLILFTLLATVSLLMGIYNRRKPPIPPAA